MENKRRFSGGVHIRASRVSGRFPSESLTGINTGRPQSEHQILTQNEEEDQVKEVIGDYLPLEEGFSSKPVTYWIAAYAKLILPSLYVAITNYGYELLNLYGIYLANQTQDVAVLSSFGLMLFSNMVITFGMFYSIEEKVSLSTSLAMGTGDFPLAKKTFWQGFATLAMVTLVFFCPIILQSEKLFRVIGFQEENIGLTSHYLKRLFPIDLLRMANEIVLGFSLAQGVDFNFGLYSIINGLVSLGAGILANYFFDLGINAWLVSKAVNEVIMSLILIYPFFYQIEPKTRGWLPIKDILVSFEFFVWDCCRFMISIYSEWIGSQLIFYFTILLNDINQIASSTSIDNIAYFTVSTGLGFNIIGRTRLNMLLGKGYRSAAKNFFYLFMAGTAIVAGLCSFTIWFFRWEIAKLYVGNQPEVRSWFIKLLNLYVWFLPLDFL